MPLYEYICRQCDARVTLRHSMDEVNARHTCPHCGGVLRRHLTPVTHWWPSNFAPGNEASGQRMFLDPENQAKWKDEFARTQEESRNKKEK